MINCTLPKYGRLAYFFDRPNYIVAPKGTVTVTIFIQEIFNPRMDESLLAPGTDGLIRAGVVLQIGVPLPTRPAFVRTAAAISGNTGFDLATVVQMPTRECPECAGILEFSERPVFGDVVSRSPTCETVLLPLGNFTFAPGEVPGEINFLNAFVTEGLSDNACASNVTESGIVLDPLIRPGSAMITVSPKALAPKQPDVSSVAKMIAAMCDGRKPR